MSTAFYDTYFFTNWQNPKKLGHKTEEADHHAACMPQNLFYLKKKKEKKLVVEIKENGGSACTMILIQIIVMSPITQK